MKTNVNSSINWINILKVLCMVLIYLNHSEFYCGTTVGELRNIYLPFFVPAFFFVSGYLLFMKQLKDPLISLNAKEWFNSVGGGKVLILNIIHKMVIPSVLFSSFIYFPKKILRGQDLDLSGFLIETIGGCTYWFTSALVLVELILVFLLLTRVKKIGFYVGMGLLAAFLGYISFESGVRCTENSNFPWFWKSALAAVFYLTLGGLYCKYEANIDKKLGLNNWWIIVLLSFVYICYCLFDFSVYKGGLDNTHITIGSALLSIIGIMVMISICKKVSTTKFFDYWGRNTIGLYFMCGAIPNTMAIILGKVMSVGVPMLIICWGLSFIVALAVVYLLNRFVPSVFDLRKSKRFQLQ